MTLPAAASHMEYDQIISVSDNCGHKTYHYAKLHDPAKHDDEIGENTENTQAADEMYLFIKDYAGQERFRIPHSWYKTGQALMCSDEIEKLFEDGHTISTTKLLLYITKLPYLEHKRC